MNWAGICFVCVMLTVWIVGPIVVVCIETPDGEN